MKKIAINSLVGGKFCFKQEDEILYGPSESVKRDDKNLIKHIEDAGAENVSGEMCRLRIVEIPDNVTDWYISNSNGVERVIYSKDNSTNPDVTNKRSKYSSTITVTCKVGENTCASEQGIFCNFFRTRSFGTKGHCALYEERLADINGWISRCSQCLRDFPSTKED